MSNPFIEEATHSFELPTTKITVNMRGLTLDEGLSFSAVQTLPAEDRPAKIKEFVSKIITWNAKDRTTKQDIPVTPEAVGQLPLTDGTYLLTEFTNFISPDDADEGKASASQSGAPSKVEEGEAA